DMPAAIKSALMKFLHSADHAEFADRDKPEILGVTIQVPDAWICLFPGLIRVRSAKFAVGLRFSRTTNDRLAQKIRGQQWRPCRHFQPRLPGSVVGETSMRLVGRFAKITKDNDL